MIIYSYQFWEAFQDVEALDAVSNLRVMPLVLLNVSLVIMISKLVGYRAKFIALYEVITEEVEELLNEMKSEYPKEVARTLNEIRMERRKGSDVKMRNRLKELEREIAARLDLSKG